MQRLCIGLIGDSNLRQYGFLEEETARACLGAKEVQIIEATVFTSFQNAFNELGNVNCLVISALMNHIADLERR